MQNYKIKTFGSVHYRSLYFPLEWSKFPFRMHQSQVKLSLLLLHKGQVSSDELIEDFSSFSSWKYSAIVTSVEHLFPAFSLSFGFDDYPLTYYLLISADSRTKGTRVRRRHVSKNSRMAFAEKLPISSDYRYLYA